MRTIADLRIIILVIGLGILNFRTVPAQIVITEDELPSTLGTTWLTLNDTTKHAIVDVGLPGEDQTWEFTQPIEGIEISQKVVALDSTPFAADFPEANWVIRYDGGLLDMIYSNIFPQIKGEVYFYQKITPSKVLLLGSGFVSPFVSGAAVFEPPNVILQFLPTQYQDTWITKSVFSITKDTTIAGIPSVLTLTVNDSVYSTIDAWGTITIPMGTYECLRMKSYVTMNEQVTLNGIPIRTRKTRVINYNWLAENYGLLVRVTSHAGEQNDNFSDARLFTRLSGFTPGSIGDVKLTEESNMPAEFNLLQNYPNPFNPITTITYQLPEESKVILKVFNTLGQEVKTLVNETKQAGTYDVLWDGKNNFEMKVPSGIYVCRMELYKLSAFSRNRVVQIRKMILIK